VGSVTLKFPGFRAMTSEESSANDYHERETQKTVLDSYSSLGTPVVSIVPLLQV